MNLNDILINIAIAAVTVIIPLVIAKIQSKKPRFYYLEILNINLFTSIVKQTEGIEILYEGEKITAKLFSIEGIIFFDSNSDIKTEITRKSIYIKLKNEKAKWKNYKLINHSQDLSIELVKNSDTEYKMLASGFKIGDFIHFNGIAESGTIEIRTDILGINRSVDTIRISVIQVFREYIKYLYILSILFLIAAVGLSPITLKKENIDKHNFYSSLNVLNKSNFDNFIALYFNGEKISLQNFDSVIGNNLQYKKDSLAIVEDSIYQILINNKINYKNRFIGALEMLKIQNRINLVENELFVDHNLLLHRINYLYDSLNSKKSIKANKFYNFFDSTIVFSFDSLKLAEYNPKPTKTLNEKRSLTNWIPSSIFLILFLFLVYLLYLFKQYNKIGKKIIRHTNSDNILKS